MRHALVILALFVAVQPPPPPRTTFAPSTRRRPNCSGPTARQARSAPRISTSPPSRSISRPSRRRPARIVVICPGGGYQNLAMDHEGHQVARWFTAHGVAAAIVKYRLGPRYRHPAPLQDVLRAIRLVRSRATELGVKPDRIGVMGFSAGGHLASSAATLFDLADAKAADGLEAVSSRPDFAILGYPVIVFGADVTHKGSQRNLLGDTPSGGSGDAAVDRSAGHREDAADLPVPHQRRRRRAAAEQRRVLPRVEERRRAGRTAHLREGRTRRRACARRPRVVDVAGSDVGVDARAGI